MIRQNSLKRGFTLIELLVVLVILTTIVLITIFYSANSAKQGKIKLTNTHLQRLVEVAQVAQYQVNSQLRLITGSNWSMGPCSGRNVINMPSNDTCYTNWVRALDKIKVAAGESYPFEVGQYYRDVWGSPFLLDENEGEVPASPCNKDSIRSAGPDGFISTSDDITYQIPLSKQPCP